MPQERFIRGRRCRTYFEGYMWIWIADTGDFAAHYDSGGRYHGSYRIMKQNIGSFIRNEYNNQILIAKAVITCFCPPCPNDGEKYMIGYRDGNKYNCNYRNLYWTEYHYRTTTLPKVRVYMDREFVEVYSTGKIKVNGQELHPFDYLFDSDMDLFWATGDASVRISKNKFPVDDIMRYAGYIHGDDAVLKEPVILHRDGDYKNFSSDNLEWVEKTDQRYTDYREKTESLRQARTKELNKGRIVPDYWK